jgi:hypothetical protein
MLTAPPNALLFGFVASKLVRSLAGAHRNAPRAGPHPESHSIFLTNAGLRRRRRLGSGAPSTRHLQFVAERPTVSAVHVLPRLGGKDGKARTD